MECLETAGEYSHDEHTHYVACTDYVGNVITKNGMYIKEEKPPAVPTIKRIPLYQADKPLKRKICAFWLKKNANYYIEEFADTCMT